MTDFAISFEYLTGHKPFPWQIELYEKWFFKGIFPRSCNLPTGLGKTSVIAIWFIALLNQPERVPRRLVYVVNRRTVVDQTTDEVEKLRENLRKLENVPDHFPELEISTLRGQFADNREWSADPSRPAVICGTVDMIGSRLLFSGYGVGFKTKPLHAGFLGQDVLLLHDEAHLEPAFQELVEAIEKEQREGERSEEMPWPKLRVMEMTATSRGNGAEEQREKLFELTPDERNPPNVIPETPTEPIHHVWRRLKATKRVYLHPSPPEKGAVAKKIALLAANYKEKQSAVLIFVRTLEDVETVEKELAKTKRDIVLLTGTMRGKERDELVKKPAFKRFLKDTARGETVYLLCTSAGEVGIDISADHMVCDLSPFDSMAQRLGRVNRYGDGDARIDVVYPTAFENDKLSRAREKTLALLQPQLPEPEDEPTDRHTDASPKALGDLRARTELPFRIEEALTPTPTILPFTDILFDAWSLTTIRGKLPGRPPVEPYLHGISEWQPPETQVAWREEVELITGDLLERYKPEDMLEDYALKPHELLRDRSDRVLKHLQVLANEHPEAPVWLVDSRDQVVVTTLKKVTDGAKNAIEYVTVLLPPLIGGLTLNGTFDGAAVRTKAKPGDPTRHEQTTNVDKSVQHDVADEWFADKDQLVKRRVRLWANDPRPKRMILEREIKFESTEEEDGEPTRVWRWFVRKPEAANERSRKAYLLEPHLDEVKACASQIVRRLRLPSDIARAVVLAAQFHDLGKDRGRWQRSLGNDHYPNEVYAKSGDLPDGTPLRPRDFFKHYRHEFGSVLDVLDDEHPSHAEFINLGRELQELVLHLIAAHHGRARPHFGIEEAFDPERNGQASEALAIETPRRFARLQRKYGRWGLAYLESLVRAADYFASANPGSADAPDKTEGQS